MPPLATAAVPRTTCSGETAMPWPKPMVSVAISFQLVAGGASGSAGLGQLDPAGACNMPIFSSQARCALGADGLGHMRRADVGRIGEDLRHIQPAVLALEIVDGEAADLDRARWRRTRSRYCTTPLSSAIEAVCSLNVLPGSYMPVTRG